MRNASAGRQIFEQLQHNVNASAIPYECEYIHCAVNKVCAENLYGELQHQFQIVCCLLLLSPARGRIALFKKIV